MSQQQRSKIEKEFKLLDFDGTREGYINDIMITEQYIIQKYPGKYFQPGEALKFAIEVERITQDSIQYEIHHALLCIKDSIK